jgi:hypothetical protein
VLFVFVGLGIVAVFLISVAKFRAKKTAHSPQPILVARDELRELVWEIQRMYAAFEIKDAPKPTLNDTHAFWLKVRAFVMQDVFKGYIGTKEIAKFDTANRYQKELSAAKAKLHEYGCFDGLTPIQIVIFDIVFDLMKRTQELLAKVELGADNPPAEPDVHPLASAMDELHAIRNYSVILLAQYRDHNSLVKPTMDELNALDNRIRMCVRRKGWGDKITIAHRAYLESPEEFSSDYLLHAAEAHDSGELKHLTEEQVGIFNAVLLKTEKVQELIARLESAK